MEKIKKILPETFVTINDINYFRLENGKIAVETINNVTINAEAEKEVELVIFDYEDKEVKFWKLDHEIYALSTSSHVTIPQDIIFEDIYLSKNYVDGVYVKYNSLGKRGILYVSETEVSIVISHKEYTEISFENELFYAETTERENKYHVIGESGKVLGAFPSKCKKLDGYLLFYDESKIFMDEKEFEVPGGIISVKIVKFNEITLVRVTNSNGIYYYSKDISLLFGPIRNERVQTLSNVSCYIYEVIDKKITQVLYIKVKSDTYICKKLECSKGIKVYKNMFFLTGDNKLYVFNDDFKLLSEDIDADDLVFNKKIFKSYDGVDKIEVYHIIGFKNKKIVCYASYSIESEVITEYFSLEQIDCGFEEDTIICRGDRYIFVINKDGKIIFSTIGRHCYKKTIRFKGGYDPKKIYVIECHFGYMELYSTDGEQM